MRPWMLFAVGLLSAPVSRADEEAITERKRLVLGRPEPLDLGRPILMGKCDDPAIVQVEEVNGKLRLVGLKAGKTLCGFWINPKLGRHTVIEITVEKP